MRLPWLLQALLLAVTVSTIRAGPLGPLPTNVTKADVKSSAADTCAVGDVVYMPGDEFPGSSPCERCRCEAGAVRCSRRCEPRPGCKAIHRPDQCCPTYQCECEQDGKTYANGEKLVDSAEPCRVCYCQGGEVVCRRIACFVRDDCKPRLVPGRCCPEYDNCPVRGVTAVTGNVPSLITLSATEKIEETTTTVAPPIRESPIKQEITIKEITPVSEIPSLSGVKIMEILPSPSAEVVDYTSSKSPLMPREVSTEKPDTSEQTNNKPYIIEVDSFSNSPVSEVTTARSANSDAAGTSESSPSKISLNNDNLNVPISSVDPAGVAVDHVDTSSTKATIIEEEDTSFFDHNPAFPPIPDDLSVFSNRGDENPEPNMENEHLYNVYVSSSTENNIVSESSPVVTFTDGQTISTDQNVAKTFKEEAIATTEHSRKDSPMLNLRSAIPTEILNVPSVIPEDVDDETDDIHESTTANVEPEGTSSPVNVIEKQFKNLESTEVLTQFKTESTVTGSAAPESSTTVKPILSSSVPETTLQEQTTNSIAKSNIATEITSQPEVTSVPIESSISTHQTTVSEEPSTKNIKDITTAQATLSTTEKVFITTTKDVVSVANAEDSTTDVTSGVFSSVSTEVTTDNVDPGVTTIKIDEVENFESNNRKSNVLADLIDLVGDVASISDNAYESLSTVSSGTSGSDIPMSEELIHVNTGYKSKNNNWNLNSITEVPMKTKGSTSNTKSKVVEIEGDDDGGITDSPAPFDNVEPTTRRPIIDNVGEDGSVTGNKTVKKEIEIITQSYVPTFNKRPTKVVMKKNSEKVDGVEMNAESPKADSPAASGETSTDDYEPTETAARIPESELTSSTILQ